MGPSTQWPIRARKKSQKKKARQQLYNKSSPIGIITLFFNTFSPYFSTLSRIPPGFLHTVATGTERGRKLARGGLNLSYSIVNLHDVSSDAVSVMKHFLKMCLLLDEMKK